jgi:NTE family protein
MDTSDSAPATTPASAQSVLVLQGGGALGSYQAGAFQALCRAGFEPEWVAGISIGAINSAIIAGNAPDKRVDRLKEFWEMVSAPVPWNPVTSGDRARSLFNETSAALIATFGVPGFFTPRLPPAVAAGQPAIAELLRHLTAEEDAGAFGRLRSHQRFEDPAQRRRGQCDLG